jgi:site-specific recombinase XerD
MERNRLCFVLSLYSGLRVGEIAALTIGDVATQNGDVRREIKLGVHQTKGSKGRTVIVSERVPKEIATFFKISSPTVIRARRYCIAAQWSSVQQCHAVDAIQGNLRDGRHSNLLTFGQKDFRDTLE